MTNFNDKLHNKLNSNNNRHIKTYDINATITKVFIQDEYINLYDDNGYLIVWMSYHHHQDCCENVYADFKYVKPYLQTIQFPLNITSISIYGVVDMGFIITLTLTELDEYDGEPKEIKWFVPCYNEQNGYYSDKLELNIDIDGNKYQLDISDYVIDEIY